MTTATDAKRVAVVPGDGIGPEVITEAVAVLEALRETHGVEHGDRLGDDLRPDAVARHDRDSLHAPRRHSSKVFAPRSDGQVASITVASSRISREYFVSAGTQ